MLYPAVHSCFEATAIETREGACDLVGEERIVFCRDEEFRDAPDVLFCGHPVEAIETLQIDRARVGAQGTFAAQVVVVLDIAQGEFAGRAVDRRAKAEAGEVRLGDAAPETLFAIEGQDVIVVVHGFEIHEQGRMAVNAQGGCGKKSSFEAVPFALAQHALRRPGGVGILIGERVYEALDFCRRVERPQCTEILRGQAPMVVSLRSVLRQFRILQR